MLFASKSESELEPSLARRCKIQKGGSALNHLMASLSVQLVIYATAWLVLGLRFQLKREVALLWSAGWFFLAVGTALVFFNTLPLPVPRNLLTNFMIVGAFVLLQRGVDEFAGHTARRWDFLYLLLGLLLIEVLRGHGDFTNTLRVCLFAAIASWPLAATGWRMARWATGNASVSRVIMLVMIAPAILVMGLFWIRAALVLLGTDSDTVSFDRGTEFDLIATVIFLVVLGAFNFSLASMVIGAMTERLRSLSDTDQLTGLANRRVAIRRLEEEHARFQRSGHGYAVVMLDLDHFKAVNDTHGHAVGDQVLCAVARELQAGQRRTDTLARMGGEEFLFLMPMTSIEGAVAQSRRIGDRIAALHIATAKAAMQITVSIGVAEAQISDASAEAVVNRSDTALYKAKAAGRNRVEVAD
ncbi:MAG: GGDEF domain-containing protein [Curvibacter sp.]|nr:MAG: GGDEF domain-containing protein [Curvibacter sp.]